MNSPRLRVDLLDAIDRAETRFADQEPLVRAFLPEEGRFERLRSEAGLLMARVAKVDEPPLLFGMLAGVKDIFHASGFETRGGSQLPPGELGGLEAESVSKLRRAGALILGKTVTTEFAYFSPGPTRNPRSLEHTPGGSSSGSAAAVAAGFCGLALGTQTIGSIIRPASFCGIVGMKPSYDRVSRAGVIPLAPSLDHVGFFTQDIFTAARVAPILYEQWHEPSRELRKPVLGVPAGPYLEQASGKARDCFGVTCRMLAQAAYEVRQVPAMADLAEIRARHDLILAAEAARVHATWFSKYENLYARKTAELIRRGMAISETELEPAKEGIARLRAELQTLMDSNGIDAWISPATTGAAPRGLESTGDPAMNLPWTQAGLPCINLPAGTDPERLPMGLQLIGRWYDDEHLLNWAADLERIVRSG
jgi:Asp-tRNA(Asn)/Glu-tRNA(Gln) amidotransferase A subunit family amidase